MRKLDYIIRRIPDYPDDGTHMQVHWDLPIEVVKGVDGFVYYSPKGEERHYNRRLRDKSPIDQRWIAGVSSDFELGTIDSETINRILQKVVHKDLEKVLQHCVKVYKKILQEELKYLELPLKGVVDVSLAEIPNKKRYKV
jgi:hypothetical protein